MRLKFFCFYLLLLAFIPSLAYGAEKPEMLDFSQGLTSENFRAMPGFIYEGVRWDDKKNSPEFTAALNAYFKDSAKGCEAMAKTAFDGEGDVDALAMLQVFSAISDENVCRMKPEDKKALHPETLEKMFVTITGQAYGYFLLAMHRILYLMQCPFDERARRCGQQIPDLFLPAAQAGHVDAMLGAAVTAISRDELSPIPPLSQEATVVDKKAYAQNIYKNPEENYWNFSAAIFGQTASSLNIGISFKRRSDFELAEYYLSLGAKNGDAISSFYLFSALTKNFFGRYDCKNAVKYLILGVLYREDGEVITNNEKRYPYGFKAGNLVTSLMTGTDEYPRCLSERDYKKAREEAYALYEAWKKKDAEKMAREASVYRVAKEFLPQTRAALDAAANQ